MVDLGRKTITNKHFAHVCNRQICSRVKCVPLGQIWRLHPYAAEGFSPQFSVVEINKFLKSTKKLGHRTLNIELTSTNNIVVFPFRKI